MRGRVFVLAAIIGMNTAAARGQQAVSETPGGCSLGTEIGRVRVVRRTALREYRSAATFATAVPGDEFPACRYEGQWAVVTVWSRRTGYRLAKGDVTRISQPTTHHLSANTENCLAADIDRIKSTSEGDEMVRRLLRLAQTRGVTIAEVADIAIESKHREYGPCRRSTPR
jgi:hypothetical protein